MDSSCEIKREAERLENRFDVLSCTQVVITSVGARRITESAPLFSVHGRDRPRDRVMNIDNGKKSRAWRPGAFNALINNAVRDDKSSLRDEKPRTEFSHSATFFQRLAFVLFNFTDVMSAISRSHVYARRLFRPSREFVEDSH